MKIWEKLKERGKREIQRDEWRDGISKMERRINQ